MDLRVLKFLPHASASSSPVFRREKWRTATALAVRVALVFCLMLAGGCSKKSRKSEAAARTYEVRGIVRNTPDLSQRTIMIEHEEIPGFMSSMTMPFAFREADVKEAMMIKKDDAISFKLNVGAKGSWISDLHRIDAAIVKLGTTPASSDAAAAPPADSTVPAAPPKPAKPQRLREGDSLPQFELVDHNERAINRVTFTGRSLLLTFIFTRCAISDSCPLIMENFRVVHEAIRVDPTLNGNINLLSISFDPDDTPAILTEYGAKVSENRENWRFATGTPQEVRKLTRAFGVQVKPENDTFKHDLVTALINPAGVVQKIWQGNDWQTDEVLAAARESLREAPAPPPATSDPP